MLTVNVYGIRVIANHLADEPFRLSLVVAVRCSAFINYLRYVYTVEPRYYGHPLDWAKVTLMER